MQVTESTKLFEIGAFLPFIEQSSVKDLKSAAERLYGNPWGLTLGEFFAYSEGDYSGIGVDFGHADQITALQYYWMESFKDMCKTLNQSLTALSVAPTPDAKKACVACRKMSFQESVKVFCREYFGLASFREVDDLTLDDLLLAKKDSYNKAIFEKGMAEIHKQKTQSK